MTANNDYILARWRDAITDPPPDGWKGHVSREWRNGTVYQYCTEYMTNPHSFEFQGERRVFYHVRPGDQWLDITDRPGVAREAVRAAVDEMEKQRKIMASTPSATDYNEAYADGLIDYHMEIKRHTGVTPSEVK